MIGAGSGAVLGAAAGKILGGRNSGVAMLAGGAVGALGGALIGGAIGRSLDQRDQARAAMATQQALNQPAPAYMIAPVQPAQPNGAPPPARRPPPRPPAGAPRTTGATTAPAARWSSDHSGATGSASVVSVQPTSDGGECRSVHEIAYVGGQEVSQDQRYCRGSGGAWQKA